MKTIPRRFPRLHDRMTMHGIMLHQPNSFYSRDELNEVLCPIGFRVISKDDAIEEIFCDAESFLRKIDKKEV